MTTKEMQIAGMTCVHCERTITEALARAGASNIRADWQQGRATFDIVGGNVEHLEEAVGEAGYKVLSIEDDVYAQTKSQPRTAGKRPDYDLIVIGSGSAAFAAAIHASDARARVALVESDVVGGPCVNVGCIPSKAMLAPVEQLYRAGHHPFSGIERVIPRFDLGEMVDSKNALVTQLRQEKYLDLADTYGFTIRKGRAEFVDSEAIMVDGERISAAKYIIATGASPAIPAIPGLIEAGYLTSTSALELRQPPKRLAVLGAGPVGLEMGQLFMRLGSDVTFISRGEVASREEPETSQTLRAVLEEEGATVVTHAQVISVERLGGRRRVIYKQAGREAALEVDQVLVATGRQPNTDGLRLERAGIQVSQGNAVEVGDDLQTSNPRVWAAGDVTGHRQFVYSAAYEGNIAARNALESGGRKVDFHSLPRVIFTSPTFAAAGLLSLIHI